jgi:hypothetical protein
MIPNRNRDPTAFEFAGQTGPIGKKTTLRTLTHLERPNSIQHGTHSLASFVSASRAQVFVGICFARVIGEVSCRADFCVGAARTPSSEK